MTVISDFVQVDHRLVMEPDPQYTERLHELVELLPKEWDKSQYVLCGSASLAVNSLRDVNDLDVLVLPELWPKVKEHFPTTVSKTKLVDEDTYDDAVINGVDTAVTDAPTAPPKPGVELWRVTDIDFFNRLLRPVATNEQVVRDAVLWEGYQVLSLRHCLAVKALGWRDKDRRDIIRALLGELDDATLQSMASRINEMNAQWVL